MTRPLDWQTPTATTTLSQLDVLSRPSTGVLETRDDWDILPRLIRAGGAPARGALTRIASFGHRGWLDVLLSLENECYTHQLVDTWRAALEACLGTQGPGAGDQDILRALSQANRAIAGSAAFERHCA